MTVAIQPASDAEARVWATALKLTGLFADVPWVLIGAQMVMLLEGEAGRPSGRTTGDVDVVVDVRAVAGATRAAAQRLVAAGFEPTSAQHPYRFVRMDAQVDLLAPDHLGPRTDLTTIPPATTVEIPGGTRALATARRLEVDVVGVGSGALPVPSLAGAIVLKVLAWHARQAARDVEDLVRLLAVVIDVEPLSRELKHSERQALSRVRPLSDPAHSAWRVATDREDAQAAFDRLASSRAPHREL
jgi:predicted nucleotidyltransferase